MVSTLLSLILLSVYYWYFYHPSFATEVVPKPLLGSPPLLPVPYSLQFRSNAPQQFHFVLNGHTVWEHTLPDETFTVSQDKIQVKDACHGIRDGEFVLATGKPLYDYLILHPDTESNVLFKAATPYTVRKGNVYHFECFEGRVQSLQMCPSGTLFVGNACRAIDSCTGKRDGLLRNHETIRSKYIVCEQETETIRDCPDRHIFHHNRCELAQDLTHYCSEFSEPFRYDRKTFIVCQNGKPIYRRCGEGYMFFDTGECEPDLCMGSQDGFKRALPDQTLQGLKFSPGYLTCRDGKIDQMVSCPPTWNTSSSSEDFLTFLPQVFDGEQCTPPTFCQNVFSEDPDAIVPSHYFFKNLPNYSISRLLDHMVGHVCENGGVRKRKRLLPGEMISKRFKVERACGPSMPLKLPIRDHVETFYDCATENVQRCPPNTFFNGEHCTEFPTNAFEFENYPVFKFDTLNEESWIKPWDYSNDVPVMCQEPESDYIKLYNICSHPDCTQMAFVSQIPDFKVLLPHDKRAYCQYDEKEKRLKKTSVSFNYHFWNQHMVQEEAEDFTEDNVCRPGQKIKTGNIIWDNTVYATCDRNQPFLFCPSVKSFGILRVDPKSNLFACRDPLEKSYVLNTLQGTVFEENEIKHISPATPYPTYYRQSKTKPMQEVPQTGVQIAAEGERVYLEITHPVLIEPQFRVTYPPNVAFDYTNGQRVVKTSSPNHSFLVKRKNFTDKLVKLPKHRPIQFLK